MKPDMVIFRHPGKLCCEATANIYREARNLFGEDTKIMLLAEGMQAWIVGDGKVYDLNNSGELIDGQFHSIAVETLGPECNMEWKSASELA